MSGRRKRKVIIDAYGKREVEVKRFKPEAILISLVCFIIFAFAVYNGYQLFSDNKENKKDRAKTKQFYEEKRVKEQLESEEKGKF